MSQPTILALDTSTKACSVALLFQGKLFSRHQMTPQSHANLLLELIEALLAEASIDEDEIDCLVYGKGPGAFTGIRIASGAVQGLALGWNKPVIAVSSLESMAKELTEPLPDQSFEWVSLMDARMGEIYWQNGEMKKGLWSAEAPLMLSPDEVELRLQKRLQDPTRTGPLNVVGDIEKEYPQIISKIETLSTDSASEIRWRSSLPSACAMTLLAADRIQEAKPLNESLPKPVYLRNHVADTIAERKAKGLL